MSEARVLSPCRRARTRSEYNTGLGLAGSRKLLSQMVEAPLRVTNVLQARVKL